MYIAVNSLTSLVCLWLFCVQEAVRIGYQPEEVEYAVNHYEGQYKTPLDFLQREWHERKMMVRNHIGRHTKERGMKDVGTPSLIEARDCLLECAGNMEEAIALCARRREEKVGISVGEECLHNVYRCLIASKRACRLARA